MRAYKKTERKYYKYTYSEFTQPTLTSNGTMGVSDFAVLANSTMEDTREVFNAFDNNSSTLYISKRAVTPVDITFYSKNKLNVKNLKITNGNYGDGDNAWTSGVVYGSNDNSNWVQLATFTNNNSAVNGVWDINLNNNEDYYNYYKISGTGRGAYVFINQITITATQRLVEEATSSDYDYYTDTDVYKIVKETEDNTDIYKAFNV